MIKTVTLITAAALTLAGCGVETTADPNIAPPVASGAAERPTEAPSAGDDGGPVQQPVKAGGHTVVYKVYGSATAGSITYGTPSGQEQRNGVRLPWTKKLKVDQFDVLVITAQNGGSGVIHCSISVDGKAVKRARSSGAYAVVTCSATIGF
jgi:hypothetical protein